MTLRIPRKAVIAACLALMAPMLLSSCAPRSSGVRKSSRREMSPREMMELYMSRGREYYARKDFRRAETEFLQAVRIEPDSADAHYLLGVTYGRQGMNGKSKEQFLEVISIDGSHSKAYYNVAALYANEGPQQNVEKAAILFRKYLELRPRSDQRAGIEEWLRKHEDRNSRSRSRDIIEERGEPVEHKEWLRRQSEMMER